MSSTFGECTCCGNVGPLDKHHKFSQTKWAIKLYGDLLHLDANIQLACNGCHASHASPKLIHWSEEEFCSALGIQPRSKSAKQTILKKDSCI